MEIWEDIKGFEGFYQVSNLSRIRSVKRWVNTANGGRQLRPSNILKPQFNNNYFHVRLSVLGKCTILLVHRVVAIQFIPNPHNKPQINHINGIKSDNRIENLEWATAQENTNHAYKNNLTIPRKGKNHHFYGKPSSKRVKIKDYKTGIVYDSVTDAAKHLGISRSHMSSMITGHRRNISSMGYLKIF